MAAIYFEKLTIKERKNVYGGVGATGETDESNCGVTTEPDSKRKNPADTPNVPCISPAHMGCDDA